MALITCPECGKKISDLAESCPNCGYPVAKYKADSIENNQPTVEPTAEESAPDFTSEPDQVDAPENQNTGNPEEVSQTQAAEDTDDAGNASPSKKRNKKWMIIAIAVASAAIIAGVLAYINLYKIPHDEAVSSFNDAVAHYNSAVDGLEERNTTLDDQIKALNTVLNTENIPIDEFLLADGKSVLEAARVVPKDSAPSIPEMPEETDEINAEADNVLQIAAQVETMGDYTDTITSLTEATDKYQTMLDQFQNCQAEVIWTGVNQEYTLLRFVAKLTNSNSYPLRDITTEWIAYDKNDAIVGSHISTQPDIPANESIFYVGGAGSANLSGMPARVELKVTSNCMLTNRTMPNITVDNVQINDSGFGSFTVTADCATDSDISAANLRGEIIVHDTEGQIIAAEFWIPENLPESIPAGGKFTLSSMILSLPAIPADAEAHVYYVWQ